MSPEDSCPESLICKAMVKRWGIKEILISFVNCSVSLFDGLLGGGENLEVRPHRNEWGPGQELCLEKYCLSPSILSPFLLWFSAATHDQLLSVIPLPSVVLCCTTGL